MLEVVLVLLAIAFEMLLMGVALAVPLVLTDAGYLWAALGCLLLTSAAVGWQSGGQVGFVRIEGTINLACALGLLVVSVIVGWRVGRAWGGPVAVAGALAMPVAMGLVLTRCETIRQRRRERLRSQEAAEAEPVGETETETGGGV